MPLLVCEQLSYERSGWSFLKPVTTTIEAGLTWVVGDEGTGKTSLLRLLAGELHATSGGLGGALVQKASPGSAAWRAQVFWQDPRSTHWDAQLTAHYLGEQAQHWPHWNAALAQDLQEALALSDHLHKRFDMLSAGTRRKFWLLAAFASGATLTLLDEPFAALDRASVRVVQELLEDACAHSNRAWVVADYEVPPDLVPDARIDLPQLPISAKK